MKELSKQDQDLIADEEHRFRSAHERIVKEIELKANQLKNDRQLARELTSQVVATRREEEKQALQSDEYVAHGLARLRLSQTHALADLVKQPYFARVIYHEKGRDVEFKLGLASFPALRIVDWRKAPISRLYYDYEEGDSYDVDIAGAQRQGTIKLKRAYRGEGPDLAEIDLKDIRYVQTRGRWEKRNKAEQLIFSLKDKNKIRQLLKSTDPEQLKRASEESGYLHNVLSLLTPEQFRLVSLEVDKPVLIQGAAGTGKTTVALHRLAWLLYADNSPARAEAALVIMFNASLAAYVKHVLPELGIHNFKIATFFEWAGDIIQTTQGNPVSFNLKDIPDAAARFKSSHRTLKALKSYLEANTPSRDLTADLLDFYRSRQGALGADNTQPVTGYLNQQIKKGFLDAYDVAFLLHIIHARDKAYRGKKYPGLLDYLVVDEVQDFTLPELAAVFEALSDKKRFTLAGDMGQRILENRDFGSWEALIGELGLSDVDVINLSIAYRSTYQIYELSEKVRNPSLSDKELKLIAKFGPDPRLIKTQGFGDAIRETQEWLHEIINENRDTIACIICKQPRQARHVFDALTKFGVHGLRLSDSGHFAFTPGITITDVNQVKGLEFTNVLLFNPSATDYRVESNHDRNLLYVAITRATYRVDVIAFDEPTGLLPDTLVVKDVTSQGTDLDTGPLHLDIDQDPSG